MLHSYHVFFIDGENDESRIHWVSGCPILEIHVLRIMRLLYINVQCGKKTLSSIAPSIGQTTSRIFCRWFSNVKCSHSSEMVRLAFPGCLHWLREVVSLSLGPQHFHNARRTAGLLPRRFRRTLADGQRLALESTQKTIKSWA